MARKTPYENKIIIGIDGGNRNGFAVWNGCEFLDIKTLSFWSVIEELAKYCDEYEWVTVYIENPSAHRPVFKAMQVYNSTNGNHTVKIGAVAKVSQDVGRVKRETELIADYCKKKDDLYLKLVTPGKNTLSKIDAKRFQTFTKYEGRTSQHGRDAAMLVFGI